MSAEPYAIPLATPELRGNEWTYVKECLDTNWVSSGGPFVERFERGLAREVGARHAVATVNGTAALHTAIVTAGIGPGDEVLVPSITFIATANAVRYAGARPIALDVDPTYGQMDPDAVESFLRQACKRTSSGLVDQNTGGRVRALLPVHALGHPAAMEPLLDVANKHDLFVIEDAAESLGSRYQGRPTGAIGRIGCLSFNGNKILTTGGGGAVVTNDELLAARARYLTTQAKDDPVRGIHNEVGFNYRLTALQAALGCAQLEALEENVRRKREIAARYGRAFKEAAGLHLMPEAPWAQSNRWLSTVVLTDSAASPLALVEALATDGIESRPLWQPLHRSRAHDGPHPSCPNADALHAAAVSLPSSVSLTINDQERVVRSVLKHVESLPRARAVVP